MSQTPAWIEDNLSRLKALNTIQKCRNASFACWLFQEGEQFYVTDLQVKLAANLSTSQKFTRQQLAQLRSGHFCAKISLRQFLYSAMINFLTNQPFLFILVNDYAVLSSELVDLAKSRLFDKDQLIAGQHELVDKQFGRIIKPAKSRTSLANTSQTSSPRAAAAATTTPSSSRPTRSSQSKTPAPTTEESATQQENLSILVGQLSSMDSLRDYTIEIVEPTAEAKRSKSPQKKSTATTNLNEAFVKTTQSLLAPDLTIEDNKSKEEDLLLLDEEDSIAKNGGSKMRTRSAGGIKLSTQLTDLPQFDNSSINSLSTTTSAEVFSPSKRKLQDTKTSSIKITRLSKGNTSPTKTRLPTDDAISTQQTDTSIRATNNTTSKSHYESTQNEAGLVTHAVQSQLISQVSPIKSRSVDDSLSCATQGTRQHTMVIKDTILINDLIVDESTKFTQHKTQSVHNPAKQPMTPLKVSLEGVGSALDRHLAMSAQVPLRRTGRFGSAMSATSSSYADTMISGAYNSNHLSSPSSIHIRRKRRLLDSHRASDDFQRSELKQLVKERLMSPLTVKTRAAKQREDVTMDADNEAEPDEVIISDDDESVSLLSDDENDDDGGGSAGGEADQRKNFTNVPEAVATIKSVPQFDLRLLTSSSSSSSVSSSSTSAKSNTSSSNTSYLSPPLHKSLIFAPKVSYSEHKPLSSIGRAHLHRIHSSGSVKKAKMSELFKPALKHGKPHPEKNNRVISALFTGRRHQDLPELSDKCYKLAKSNSLVLDRLISLGGDDEDAERPKTALEKESRRRRLFNPNSYNIDGAFETNETAALSPGILTLRKETDNILRATAAGSPSKLSQSAAALSSSLVRKDPTVRDLGLNRFYNKMLMEDTALNQSKSQESKTASFHSTTTQASNKEQTSSETSSLLLQISTDRSIPAGQLANVSNISHENSSNKSNGSLFSALGSSANSSSNHTANDTNQPELVEIAEPNKEAPARAPSPVQVAALAPAVAAAAAEPPFISLEMALINYRFKLNPDNLQDYLVESKLSN